MVALENGEVYAWGYNGNGQLGLGNNINQLNACKITPLSGIVVTKVLPAAYARDISISFNVLFYILTLSSR